MVGIHQELHTHRITQRRALWVLTSGSRGSRVLDASRLLSLPTGQALTASLSVSDSVPKQQVDLSATFYYHITDYFVYGLDGEEQTLAPALERA